MPSPYTESTLVQQTIADYLEQQLGWVSVYAYNREDFGADSLLGRGSDREVVLERDLWAALERLNPGFPDSAYHDALQQIVATTAAQTLVATNQEKHNLLRDGVAVSFADADNALKQARLQVFDFALPENNDFLCVRELWINGELYRRRADLVGFVNGLPLLFVECKNLHKHLRAAFEQNFSDYKDTIPHLFYYNAVVMLSNGEQGRLGSITSYWEHFHEWKRLSEQDVGVVDMETMLKGVCSKQNFMDIVENFILFDDSSGAVNKIIARNHQFLGVNQAFAAVATRQESKHAGKLGVFWHTQGAGKSYSMVMFTRKVHRKLGGNFTFVVLTDRDDLDAQIYKTFSGCGVTNHDRDPCRAASGEHLKQLLAEHKTYVFALIQKFNQVVDRAYTAREKVIVITDEAHRTQYSGLAHNMRQALPNASFIGFTGTPLFKDDEITRRFFGDYLSTYDFQRAVEDGATLPLYYDARGDDLKLSVGDLNARIAEVLEEVEVDDIDVAQRLEQQLMREYHIITASKRLDKISQDLVWHYSNAWENGKVMLVCIDKITCLKMHALIVKYWQARIDELKKALATVADEQEGIYRQRQIVWMEATLAAVMVSDEQGEVERFRQWGVDIRPHRRLIKRGLELPESMRAKPAYRNMQRMPFDQAFKAEEHPFRIAIVCAMWLTGFDVPCLSTLYLDKPLKAHTLMQAIARANRVHSGKNNGLIVDYCGVLKHLRKALATFATASKDSNRVIVPCMPQAELLETLAKAIALVREFFDQRGGSLEQITNTVGFERINAVMKCKEAANQNDETRKRFEVLCREVFKIFKACGTLPGVAAHRAARDAIDIVYKSLQQDRAQADIASIMRQLYQVVDAAVETVENALRDEDLYDISKIDFVRLKEEFERIPHKKTLTQDLRQAVENHLQQLLERNPLRANFQKRFEEIIAEYNREKDQLTIQQTFEKLLKFEQELAAEQKRALREGLDEESLAVFDLLQKPHLRPAEIRRIKRVARQLLEILKAEKLRIDQWRDKESTRAAVKQTILDFLYAGDTGLPEPGYSDAEITEKADIVYRHVYRVYPTLPSPLYIVGVGANAGV